MQAIEFRDFSCYYKVKKEYVMALDHIHLQVPRGEFLVILGQSGSGKTTLLKCILGLCDYIGGELFIDGVSTDQFKVHNSNIGYIKQELNLYPHLTVYENIAFPLRMIHTAQEEVDHRVKELASLLEIDWLLTRKPKQLSGGQNQRVAIARALIKNPVMVLFDEPFSGVDPSLRTELRSLIKKIHQAFGCTILFVTHEPADAFALADRVVILENGSIVADGAPSVLLEKGYL